MQFKWVISGVTMLSLLSIGGVVSAQALTHDDSSSNSTNQAETNAWLTSSSVKDTAKPTKPTKDEASGVGKTKVSSYHQDRFHGSTSKAISSSKKTSESKSTSSNERSSDANSSSTKRSDTTQRSQVDVQTNVAIDSLTLSNYLNRLQQGNSPVAKATVDGQQVALTLNEDQVSKFNYDDMTMILTDIANNIKNSAQNSHTVIKTVLIYNGQHQFVKQF